MFINIWKIGRKGDNIISSNDKKFVFFYFRIFNTKKSQKWKC